MLGFVRQGAKWGWKMGLFAGIFSGCNILLTQYRDREDGMNLIASGAITGTLFRVRYGVKPAIGGLVLGTLISLPIGLVVQGLDLLLVSKEERERMKRKRFEQRRKREQMWNERLKVTETIVGDLEFELENSRSERGLREYYSLKDDVK